MLREVEKLIQAHVKCVQTRTADGADPASAKCSRISRPVGGCIEPLVTAQWRILFTKNVRRRDTVGARTAGVGARSVASRNSEREAGVQAKNAIHLPAADYRVQSLVHILPISAVASERNVVRRVAGENVRRVVIARAPFGFLVVEVLPVRRCRSGLTAPGAVVAAGIGHALRIGVSNGVF